MKIIQKVVLAFVATFAIMTTAQADPLDNLSPYDGVAALRAGDAVGLEVIPRSELEEVRGENYYALATILRLVPKAYQSLYTCGINGICAGPIIKTWPKATKSGGGSW